MTDPSTQRKIGQRDCVDHGLTVEHYGYVLATHGDHKSVPLADIMVGVEQASSSCRRQSWAMRIKPVYEVDPLSCPACGSQMEVVALIEPPQKDAFERILRQVGRDAPRQPERHRPIARATVWTLPLARIPSRTN